MYTQLKRLAKKMTYKRPYADWHDLVQEAYAELLENHVPKQNIQEEAVRIMNAILKREHEILRRSISIDQLDGHREEIVDSEYVSRYADCLSGSQENNVVSLHKAGLNITEISSITGINRTTIRNMLKE